MRGIHHLNRMIFFLFSGRGHRYRSAAQRQRMERVKAAENSPEVQAFWQGLQEIRDGRKATIARADPAGRSGDVADRRLGIPEQPQSNRSDAGGVQYPAGSSGGTATVTGWYFWADDRLYEGFQTWDALQAGLEEAIGNAPKKISEVKYYDSKTGV